MAIGKGPGQAENNTRQAMNMPGVYKDPQSGAVLHVSHPSGADALDRLGWELQIETPDGKAPDGFKSGVPAEKAAPNKAKVTNTKEEE